MDTFCAFLSCASTWVGNINIITSLIATYGTGMISVICGGGFSALSALSGVVGSVIQGTMGGCGNFVDTIASFLQGIIP